MSFVENKIFTATGVDVELGCFYHGYDVMTVESSCVDEYVGSEVVLCGL